MRDIRARRGITQKEMATELSADEGWLSRILREQVLPDRALSIRCRDRYGLDPAVWDQPPIDEQPEGDAA